MRAVAHEIGAAAYAIKAACAAAPVGLTETSGRLECQLQREQLVEAIRELVLDDQRLRNDICGSVSTVENPTLRGPRGGRFGVSLDSGN